MNSGSRQRLCIAVMCIAVGALTGVARADLPEGRGKDLTRKVCGTCHAAERVAELHQAREDWEGTIGKMAAMAPDKPMEATPEEFNTILDYLVKNFGPEALRPIQVNKATAVELESGLGLLRKEAAAIIQYREEKGDFKSLDDLKKVPGVDVRKLEAKKDRLVF